MRSADSDSTTTPPAALRPSDRKSPTAAARLDRPQLERAINDRERGLHEPLDADPEALDLLAAGITFMVVQIADLPPDENHPYGHARAENLGALAEAVLLVEMERDDQPAARAGCC